MNPIRSFFVWTLTATLLFIGTTLSADDKQNLLPNGNFESHRNGKVVSWISKTNQLGKAVYLLNPDMKSGNQAAIQLICAGSDQDRWFLPNARSPKVEAGKHYELSVNAQTAHFDKDDNVRVAIVWLDADRKTITAKHGDRIQGNHESITVTVTAKAPNNAVSVRPMLIASNGKNNSMPADGNVIFDNASLHQIDAPTQGQAQSNPTTKPDVFNPAKLSPLTLAQLNTLWEFPGIQSSNAWSAPLATSTFDGDGKVLESQANLISLQLDDVKKKSTL